MFKEMLGLDIVLVNYLPAGILELCSFCQFGISNEMVGHCFCASPPTSTEVDVELCQPLVGGVAHKNRVLSPAGFLRTHSS